jgi:hypothetical protein
MIKLNNGQVIAGNQFDINVKLPTHFQTANNYNEFLLNSLHLLFTDNLFFYQIPQSFKVYSSTSDLPKSNISLYLNTHDIKSEGSVYEHEIIHPIRVVALDKKSNCDILIATAIQNGLIGMDQVFRNGNLTEMSKYLCSLGISGFISKFTTDSPYSIHLCSSKDVSQGILFV